MAGMMSPDQMPDPDPNMVVAIFGASWPDGIEGYWKDGKWWRCQVGLDVIVEITGWQYLADGN